MAFKIERKTLLGFWIVIGLLIATLFFIGHRTSQLVVSAPTGQVATATVAVSFHDNKWFDEQLVADVKAGTIKDLPTLAELDAAKASMNPQLRIDVFAKTRFAYLAHLGDNLNSPDFNTVTEKYAHFAHLGGAIYQVSLHDNSAACSLYKMAVDANPSNVLYQREVEICK